MIASLSIDNGVLLYRSPYNAALVMALKTAIPASDRKWDQLRKVWLIAPQYGQTLVALTEQYFGVTLELPRIAGGAAQTETRVLEVRYVGAAKERNDGGERTAFGWVNGEWLAIFPEKVLLAWFNIETRPDEELTFYGILGIKQAATFLDVKHAYRRLSLQWHPDRCREPDAAQQFITIKHAYEVLSDPRARARYNAGLALAATQHPDRDVSSDTFAGYRAPLRCGLILATGIETIGRFVVHEILAWADIIDGTGRVLVTSWPMGAKAPEEVWQ